MAASASIFSQGGKKEQHASNFPTQRCVCLHVHRAASCVFWLVARAPGIPMVSYSDLVWLEGEVAEG